jgi:hypothetical protein
VLVSFRKSTSGGRLTSPYSTGGVGYADSDRLLDERAPSGQDSTGQGDAFRTAIVVLIGIQLELLISVRNILIDGQRLLTLGCRGQGWVWKPV